MEKLPHEKLREAAKTEADERNYYPCVVAAKDFGAMDDTRYTTEVKLLNAIANEIEKYYDPKPRDPEGNPVHEDMEVEGGVVKHWSVSEDGSWTIFDDDYEEIQCGDKNEPIRLPEPKILDADGVEIKVGDTVWLTTSGKKLRVDGFTPWKYVRCSNPEIDGDHEAGLNFAPESLTHREPDSLEKLRDDIDMYVRNGWNISQPKAEEFASRLTAIMERDA
jgi:hypothetical protein